MQKKKTNKYVIIVILLLFICFFTFIVLKKDSYSALAQTMVQTENGKLRVLVIEINPILKSITNKSLYPNNNGHPLVSEWFNQDKEKTLNEFIEDFETSSHDYLDVEIVKREYLDEFPKYTKPLNKVDVKGYTYPSGDLYSYPEDLYVKLSTSSSNSDKGYWYGFIMGDTNKKIVENNDYTFDYEYIIEKYDLVNRRNNDEFDQVWLLTIDPALTNETKMIGNKAYWINGQPITKDCQNFVIANITIARPDANLHAYNHGVENLMARVFDKKTGMSYKNRNYTYTNFTDLSYWARFTLSKEEAKYGECTVGNVHFPFNGEEVYDYSNTKYCNSNWKEWLEDYPNITNTKTEKSNNDAWMKFPFNTALSSNENKDPDRLYQRWWLYLFPHYDGRTSDGYNNNWWKYIINFDFISEIILDSEYNIEINSNDPLDYKVKYYSAGEKNRSTSEDDYNITSSNNSVIEIKDGKLNAKKLGKSTITINLDGVKKSTVVYVQDSSLLSRTIHEDFPDNNFYKCIVNNFNNNENYLSYKLTSDDYKKITSLSCDDSSIKSIKGIEKLTNLVSLSIRNAQLDNIDLSKLTNIRNLSLNTDTIKNIILPKPTASYLKLDLRNNQINNLDLRGVKSSSIYLSGQDITLVVDNESKFSDYGFRKVKLYKQDEEINDFDTIIGTGSFIEETIDDKKNIYSFIVYGDVNGDGKISASDYVKIRNYLMNLNILTGIYEKSADYNEDNEISASDYVLIRNYIMNI